MNPPNHPTGMSPGPRAGLLAKLIGAANPAIRALEFLALALDLGIRILVGSVFFKSGLTKIASWDSTLALFESEYAVPFLPPELAAYLGTAIELQPDAGRR